MKIFDKILPKKGSNWRTFSVFAIAVVLGIGFFIIREAEVVSYLSDNPMACVNCHNMTPMYNSWNHSSHREWASCNDCHVPHNNIVNSYYFKAKDGLYHASVFTTRTEPDVIFMKEASAEVVQNNCVRCHVDQVTETKYDGWVEGHVDSRINRPCWECHKEVPHGRVHGMSSIRYNIAPLPSDQEKVVIPKWLEKELESKQ